MRWPVALLCLLGWATLAAAKPSLVISPQSQLPPVARVGQDFVWDVAPGSFSSSSPIQYSVDGLPSWLNFSSQVITFSGHPSAKDVGQYNFTLNAADGNGTTSTGINLIVTDEPAPTVGMAFSSQLQDPSSRQLSSVQIMSNNQGVTVPPRWSFSLGWNGNTFKTAEGGKRLFLDARLKDGRPLPQWLEFSNTTYTFNGVAPADGVYPVVVTGTDYWGYRAATSEFIMSVGGGDPVVLTGQWQPINTVARSKVNYQIDTSVVTLGGKNVDASALKVNALLNNFDWLSFDNKTNTISGTTPDNLVNGTVVPMNLPVSLASTNSSNTLGYLAYTKLNVLPYFFTNFTLPDGHAAVNETFTYDLSPYISAGSPSINATVIPAEAAKWLTYYYENRTLVGTPPGNITYNSINLTFMGAVNNVAATTQVFVPIDGVQQPPQTNDSAPVPNGTVHKKTNKALIIGCVVGIVGGLLVLGLLVLLLCCCRRRRKGGKRVSFSSKADSDPFAKRDRAQRTPSTLVGTPDAKKKLDDGSISSATTAQSTPLATPLLPRFTGFGAPTLGGNNETAETTEATDKVEALRTRDNSHASSFVGQGEMIGSVDPNASLTQTPKAPKKTSSGAKAAAAAAAASAAAGAGAAGAAKVTKSGSGQSAPHPSRRTFSGESLASWESQPSFHWSDESNYLPPLTLPSDGVPSTANNSVVNTSVIPGVPIPSSETADMLAAGDVARSPPGPIPRPLPGFYPRFPRHIAPGQPAPFISSDNLPSIDFSEFRDTSSRSLHSTSHSNLHSNSHSNSFADSGSPINSTWFPSRSTNAISSGEVLYSGAFTSGGYLSSDEPVIQTAQRQSLEAQRSTIVEVSAPPSVVTPPYMASSTVPTPPVVHTPSPLSVEKQRNAQRRVSSQRRPPAERTNSTREHIVGDAPVEPADDGYWTTDEA